MDPKLEAVLDHCISRVRCGESPESCLDAFPGEAEALRPLLHLVGGIQSLPRPQARPQAVEAGRQRVLAALDDRRGQRAAFWKRLLRCFRRLPVVLVGLFAGRRRTALGVALRSLLVLLLLSAGLFPVGLAASAGSLPGDVLYPVKRSGEQIRLLFTWDDQARQDLQDRYAEERRREVQAVLDLRRQVTVEIKGELASIHKNRWMVSEFNIILRDDTIVEGTPALGLVVYVQAQSTLDGTLEARYVRVLTTPVPSPAPPPSAETLPPIHPATTTPSQSPAAAPTVVDAAKTPVPTTTSLPAIVPTLVVPTLPPEPTPEGPAPTTAPALSTNTPTPTSRSIGAPTATPEAPIPTSTPTALPTSTQEASPTSTATATATTPSSSPTPSPSPTPTPTCTLTSTPGPSATPTALPTSTSTPMPTPTSSPTPTQELPSPTPTPTPTPSPSSTPLPTPTPTPTERGDPIVSLVGVVRAMSSPMITVEDYQGMMFDVAIVSDTVIVGDPQVGEIVSIDAEQAPSGSLTALYIEVLNNIPGPSFPIEGVVAEIDETHVVVDAYDGTRYNVAIVADTIIVGDPQVDSHVFVEAVEFPMGTFTALQLAVQAPPVDLVFQGVVVAIDSGRIAVDDQAGTVWNLTIVPDTVLVGDPQVSDQVYVEAAQQPIGGLVALYIEVIEPPQETVQLAGRVVAVDPSTIVLEDPAGGLYHMAIVPETVIVGDPQVGDQAYVEANVLPDGGLAACYIEKNAGTFLPNCTSMKGGDAATNERRL